MATDEYKLPENTHITIDENGKYCWRGTINVRDNPTMVILIAKTMGIIFGATLAISIGIGLACHMSAQDWVMMLSITVGVILVVAVISVIVTLMYLNNLDGTYSADYVMDETGVLFRPAPREQEINKEFAMGSAAFSTLAGRPALAAAGVATVNSDAVSKFKSVHRVKGIREHCCIKVSNPLLYNQVYVAPEDYDFVYRFISSHCPNAKCTEV